jgi:hypothetical protein
MPEVGQTARRSRRVSAKDIELFTEISGDRNPRHYDEVIAQSTPFGGIVVQGGVISAILNGVRRGTSLVQAPSFYRQTGVLGSPCLREIPSTERWMFSKSEGINRCRSWGPGCCSRMEAWSWKARRFATPCPSTLKIWVTWLRGLGAGGSARDSITGERKLGHEAGAMRPPSDLIVESQLDSLYTKQEI